jgi:hypothetical protein
MLRIALTAALAVLAVAAPAVQAEPVRSTKTVEADRAIRSGAEMFAAFLSPSAKTPRMHYRDWRGDRHRRRVDVTGRVGGTRFSFRFHVRRPANNGDFFGWASRVRVTPQR